MSDFDEEAERERLRERFEREEQKRASTERMSELLLKGATMTNAHCSDCGDPVFRYDGQEFCATCQKAVEREQPAEEDENGRSDDTVEVTSPDETRVQFGGEADAAASATDADAETADDGGAEPAADADDEPDAPTPGGDGTTAQADASTGSPPSPTPSASSRQRAPGSADDVASTIAGARADLAATLARFARAARDSESPAAAREHLDAALAAAETLDELD